MGVVSGDAIEHLLALSMLTNAQLSTTVLQSAKLSLQRRAIEASERKTVPERARELVSQRSLNIRSLCEQLDDISGSSAGEAAQEATSTTEMVIKSIREEISKLEKEISQLVPKTVSGPLPLMESSRFDLHLDDAANTLLTLSSDHEKQGRQKERGAYDHDIGKRLTEMNKVLLSTQKQISKHHGRTMAPNRLKNIRSRGAAEASVPPRGEKRGECWDCGSRSHYRGDRSCPSPSERTKQLWSREDSFAAKNN
jgi:hypothetical protein